VRKRLESGGRAIETPLAESCHKLNSLQRKTSHTALFMPQNFGRPAETSSPGFYNHNRLNFNNVLAQATFALPASS
jgi:hypothetical protein